MEEKQKIIYSNLKRLDSMTDEDIDYSDSPSADEEFWKNAKLILPKNKTPITIRLDDDILEFFKSQGKGYQTTINAVLKSYVAAQKGQ